jgi:D-serine deaminase-like pyridoxal phosphate-dependent protein
MFLKSLPIDTASLKAFFSSERAALNVLKGDVSSPVLILKDSALESNLASMAAWIAEEGLLLAPHGKTTMCPAIFKRQLAHGAWGLTLASVSQLKAGLEAGFRRIIIANQVAGKANLRTLVDFVNKQPDCEFFCFVDSVEGVNQLAAAFVEFQATRPLNVFLEWGYKGGRCGVRSIEEGREVMAAVMTHKRELVMCGFSGFEGLADSAAAVDEFLKGLEALSTHLGEGIERPLVSAGGSAYLDRICEFARSLTNPFNVVVRSGCYVTHDHGQYLRKSLEADERSDRSMKLPAFTPALELWSSVQSIPEAGLALLNFGKRDTAYDLDLPIALAAVGEGKSRDEITQLQNSRIFKLNDQHAYLSFEGDDHFKVGDLVCCGISHPCTAFDKWRIIALIDDDYHVKDLYTTLF